MGRVFVFLVGVALAAAAWALHDPTVLSHLGPAAAGKIDLGPAEAFRPLVAIGVGVLGLLLTLSAFIGHRGARSPHGHKPPQPLTFETDDFSVIPPMAEPETAPAAAAVESLSFLRGSVEPPELDALGFPAIKPKPQGAPELDVLGFPLITAKTTPEPDFEPPVLEPVALEPVAPEPVVQAEPYIEPAVVEPEPEPVLEPVATAPVAEAAIAEELVVETPAEPTPAAPPEDFNAARERLRGLARDENWAGVGVVLAGLPRLAATDTEHALAAQDLGTFYRSQGKPDEAAEAFEEALHYARASGDSDLLASALTDVGDVALEQSRLEPAVNSYTELVELRRAAVATAPSPDSRRLLSLALERLGDAREDRGHRTRALALYQESLVIAGDLAAQDPAKYGAELAVTRGRVAELEALLA